MRAQPSPGCCQPPQHPSSSSHLRAVELLTPLLANPLLVPAPPEPSREQHTQREQSRAGQSTARFLAGKGRRAGGSGADSLPCLLPMGCLLTDVARAACEDPEQRVQLLRSSPAHLLQPTHPHGDLSPGAARSASFSPAQAAPV